MAVFTAFLYFSPFKKSLLAIMVLSLSVKDSSVISTPPKILEILILK